MRIRITSSANGRMALAGLLLLWCAGPQKFASGATPVQTPNRAREAKFLYNIAEFVDWPASSSSRVVNFCVLGSDPFGKSLDASVLGRSIGARRTIVVRAQHLEDFGECDVLFISSSEGQQQAKILDSLRGKRVLTAGETPNFAASGGVIQFVRRGDDVTFLINLDAAKRAGLKIDSKLLALAAIVYGSAKSHN